MQVYTQVARDYGIGNLDRAQKVIKVICENLVSAPEQTRTVFLDRLALHAHEQRPISEIIGRMEGSYVHFALPGIQPLMQGLSEFEIDPLSISGPQLEKIAAKFTEPPQKRISMEAILSNGMQTTRLLSNVLEPVAGLLPAPDNAIAKDQEGPLSRMLGFYEQLKAECGHLDIQVSNVYFSFCATRMPDPFAPPKGMLRFLKRYLEIPDPNYRWTAMEHPGNRATVSRQNQERTVRRYALISHLLDTWVCGLATWEQIHGILEWMTEEPSKEFIEEKKRTMAEEKKQGKAEGKRYRQQQIQEKREEYLAEIAKSLENSMRSRDEETKEKYDRNLKYLVKRRDGAAKDLYPDRDDDNDEAHRPGRSWHKRHQKDLLNREVRQQYYETCQRRIMTVADGIHLLEKLGMLVAAKVAPPETFRKAAWGLLQEWREKITVDVGEKEKHEGEHIESMQSLGYTIGNLRNMGDLAVLSEAAIGEIVQTHKGERGIREVISVLEQAAHAWRKTYDMLEQMLRSVSNHPARNPGGLIARQMEVFKEISAIWRGIPCVSDAPALILRKTFGWMHRYGSVAEVVTSMDSTKMEPGDLGRTNSIVRRAVRSITGLSLYDKHDCAPQMPRIGEFHPPETEVRDIIVSDPSLRLPEMSDMRCLIAAESESWMQEVLKWRRQSVGLLPVGAKIHVLHPIDDQKFNAIQHMLDLGKSGFYLIHANTCLIIPPTPSIEELSMIITFLAKEGVIDLDHPEIQFCYPGRLPPKDVAVLGSSILLSTDRGVRFEEKAFCTTHDNLTGARMMAYDAGAPNVDLPFMRDVKGRTDILGRRSLRDGAMGQRIATLLVDRMFGHLFTHLADPFCEKQYEILKRYGIEGVLDAPWIATCSDEAMDNDKNRKHYHQAVKPCVDAYFDCAERMQAGEAGGIITEMRELDAWLIAQMRPIQETLPMQESYRDACVQVLQL
jgi:hypothetical protein